MLWSIFSGTNRTFKFQTLKSQLSLKLYAKPNRSADGRLGINVGSSKLHDRPTIIIL